MRHGVAFKKFGRTPAHRRALLRNMATSFFLAEKYETTLQKAKDLRRVVEKLITLAKEDTVHHRKQAHSYLLDKEAVVKLFTVIGPRYKTRNGGYTRVLRTRFRHGDSASLAYISLVEGQDVKPKAKKAKAPAKGKKKAEKADKTETSEKTDSAKEKAE